MNIPEASGTYASRKFCITVLGIVLITSMAVLGVFFPAVPAIMPTFTGGIIGIVSLYFTGNIMNKYVVGKVDLEEKRIENAEEGEV